MTSPYSPAALRALADLIERADVPAPAFMSVGGGVHWTSNSVTGSVAEHVADLARRIGGTWAKNDPNRGGFHADYYELTRSFVGLTLSITAERAVVCERVQVGEREVTREIPTATTTVTETEPVYEWRCAPLLAKAEATS